MPTFGGTQRGERERQSEATTAERQLDAIRRNQTQSDAIRRNQMQSDAIRRNRTQSDAIGRNHLQQVNELRPIDAQIRCAFSTLRIFRRIFRGLVWVHRTRVRLEEEIEGLVGFLGRSER